MNIYNFIKYCILINVLYSDRWHDMVRQWQCAVAGAGAGRGRGSPGAPVGGSPTPSVHAQATAGRKTCAGQGSTHGPESTRSVYYRWRKIATCYMVPFILFSERNSDIISKLIKVWL